MGNEIGFYLFNFLVETETFIKTELKKAYKGGIDLVQPIQIITRPNKVQIKIKTISELKNGQQNRI